MVVGMAAHVGGYTFASQGADGAGSAKQLDRPIGGRESEPGIGLAGAVVYLDDGEATPELVDRFEDDAALARQPGTRRKRQRLTLGQARSGRHNSTIDENDSH